MRNNYQICTKKGNGTFNIVETIRAGSPVNAETKFRTQRVKPRSRTYYVRYQGVIKKIFKIRSKK